MEKTQLHFFKRNVPYVIGVRYFIGDNKGKTLTGEEPFVAIEEDDLRDFKRANKYLLEEGLILETTEPVFDDESPNAITDEKADELVKNLFTLRKTLPDITSASILGKLLEAAKTGNRSKKTIDAIQERLDEVESQDVMLGVRHDVAIKDGVKTYSASTDELKKATKSQ